MTFRAAALFAASSVALLAGLPAWAQATPDFGDDSSTWAKDGECDDPRFTGQGMAGVTIEADLMADATDCRAAYQAGTVQLIEAQTGAQTGDQPAAPAPSGKGAPAVPLATPGTPAAPAAPATAPAAPAGATAVDFGDDSGQYPNDGECDDRRFVGQGMAAALGRSEVGRDASDCRALLEAGQLRLWNPLEAQAATRCSAIDFGADAGEFANDGQCDDIRFEGLGSASLVRPQETGTDATDCQRLCNFGAISLRDY